MNDIQIGKIGKIVAGRDPGRFVIIEDDSENTGGFLILTSDDCEFRTGFDDWVEDRATLEDYFQRQDWLVEWAE